MVPEKKKRKKVLHVMRHAPHGTVYSYEGLEMILMMAAYELDLSVAFIGDGVYALKKEQDTTDIGIKGYVKTFGALRDYDVEKLYVDRVSLEERGLIPGDLVIGAEVLESQEIGRLMELQDIIMHH
jgi:tRNA 2-thiouridine synthesizing protein C